MKRIGDVCCIVISLATLCYLLWQIARAGWL